MHASFRAPTAFALTLVVPLFSAPALGPGREPEHKPAPFHSSAFASARAPVSPAAPVAQAPETDGLSRKDEECVFGCVDH
jgi:hypothetical protein